MHKLLHARQRGRLKRAAVVVWKDDGAAKIPLRQRLIEIGVVAVRVDRQHQRLANLLGGREAGDIGIYALVKAGWWSIRWRSGWQAGSRRHAGWCCCREKCRRRYSRHRAAATASYHKERHAEARC